MPYKSRGFAPSEQQGLYDPAFEHDACGVGFVVDMHARPSHGRVARGISPLSPLAPRGAAGAEATAGGGGGILTQVPAGFRRWVVGGEPPPMGSYAVGCAFLPRGDAECATAMATIEKIAASE